MITIDLPSSDHTLIPLLSRPSLTRFLRRALASANLPPSVSVLLTSDRKMKQLNRSFRGKNKATDVLSFPAAELKGLPAIHRHAGDLAISLEIAQRQAVAVGHPIETELRILMLHGLLHLAGFDHEVDHGEMAAREMTLRSRFRLPTSLIDRTLIDKPGTPAARRASASRRRSQP